MIFQNTRDSEKPPQDSKKKINNKKKEKQVIVKGSYILALAFPTTMHRKDTVFKILKENHYQAIILQLAKIPAKLGG